MLPSKNPVIVPPSPGRVLVLVGPTASGKTPLSLELAHLLNGEIISADSRQIYKFMDIGTAKPSVEERNRVKHYFVDEITPDQDFNAGEYGKKGREIIRDVFRRKKQPIVVGGSGLYIQSLIDGFFEGPPRDEEVRRKLSVRMEREGGEALLRELTAVDPDAAAGMLPSNTRRIIRALEVYYLTGTPLSHHHKNQKRETDFEPVFVGLDWERSTLYRRIDARVDSMLQQGLVDEVKALAAKGYDASLNALQTVGYQEVFDFLNGATSYERMTALIKQNSRRYAKRQLTWFRRDKRIRWFPMDEKIELGEVAKKVAEDFRKI